MDPVVHFEMPYEDKVRAADFYTKAFGWQAEQLGPEMGEYIVVTTTALDPASRRPKEPGAINGGLFKKNEDNKYPAVVIGVKDIREVMEKVEAAGGKVVAGATGGEPVEIPGVGFYVSIIDTEGNRLSLLQPKEM